MDAPVKLMENEKVTVIIRRHRVYVAIKIALSSIILLCSLYVLLILDPDPGIVGSLFEFVFSVLGVVSALSIIAFLYAYWNDTWFITNQRLIDSARNHPFHHSLKTISLEKVQDVSVSVDGLLPTLLGFGDVRCRTASTDSSFIFGGVPEPSKVMETINHNVGQYVPHQKRNN